MTNKEFQNTIDSFLAEPIKTPTKEEAKQHLINCGILNKDGTIAKRYQGIIAKRS